MAVKKYVNYLFKVIDIFIIHLMLIHVWTWDKIYWPGKTSFDKSFLPFNVKKKIYERINLKEHSQFACKYWILDTASLNN